MTEVVGVLPGVAAPPAEGTSGAGAARPWRIPLSDVAVDEELLDAVQETLASGWWSMGPRVEEFERAFADFTGSRFAIAVSSGTAALHLALLAVGCREGDEVVLPALTFVAAANTVVHAGALPVLCDVNGARDLNLDPHDLRDAITPATRAIVVLHYGGHACDMADVMEIARERGVAVIEDAAHAPGGTVGGRPAGTIGTIGCFSFFANKNLPVGEGGMIVTDAPELAERMRLLRSHGMTTLTWDRHRGHASAYDVLENGFNYRLDELRAAIGLVQLRRLPAENAARVRLLDRYTDALCDVDGLVIPFSDAQGEALRAPHLAVVVLAEGTERAAVRAALARDGIQTSVHYPPIHHFSAFRRLARRDLTRVDQVAERLLTLPLHGGMSDSDVDMVAARLRALL